MSSALLHGLHLLLLMWIIFILESHAYGDIRFANTPIFSTKTPYFWVKHSDEVIREDSEFVYEGTDTIESANSCFSFHINSLIRHGIRYPGLKWIKRMDEVHEKLTKAAINSKSTFIEKWANPFPYEKEHALATLGETELFALGERFSQRFKLLFEEETDKIEYFVSSKERTSDSRKAFHKGLTKIFDPDIDDDHNLSLPVLDDSTLRFHAGCQKYIDQIEKNDTALQEYFKFKDGPEMKSVVSDVTGRILDSGVDAENLLSADDVQTIHQICAFELAFYGKSDWCQYFEQKDMEVIDYLNDLKHYWQKAYGYKLSSEMSCPLVQQIFQRMDNAVSDFEDGEDSSVGIFRFAHAETLGPLYAALGLYKDSEPLMANNFGKQRNRLFRSSKILPFAANVAFVLYECDTNSDEDDIDETEEESIYVKLYVNEEAVIIPACGKILCLYTDVRRYYSHFIDACDFDEICKKNKIQDHDEL